MCDRVAMAGQVHDVGKLAIPAEVLAKPGRLSPIEMEIVKNHSRQGYEILRKSHFSWPLAEIVLQHHERYDGSGYPEGCAATRSCSRRASSRRGCRRVDVESASLPAAAHARVALAEIEPGAGTAMTPSCGVPAWRLFREQGYKLPG
jgi:hypothetical protein